MTPYYQDDWCTIYHGDCRDVSPSVSADFVITDPPYLEGDFSWILDIVTRPFVVTPGKTWAFTWIQRECPTWQYIWRGNSTSRGGRACLHIGFEPILAYGWPHTPLGTDILTYPINHRDRDNTHPWPKPLGLITKLVQHWSHAADTVYDPFMGSGTILRAAKDFGRKAIGIEIEERWCEVAAKRLEQEVLPLKFA